VSELKVEIRRMKLADMKPADYNPRVISDEAFEGLGNSIERFGMLAHIVWNKRTGNIVGGHQRYRHLASMGETETDVVVVDLDDNEEVALNITLNNKEVRGEFTKDVMAQLRTTEAQLGSAFKALGLLNLYEYLKSRGYDRKPKQKKQKTSAPPGDSGDQGGKVSSDPPRTDTSPKPQIVIVCPKCRSQWRMRDNEVVFNSVTNMGSPVGVRQNAKTVEN
jgi:hypothetical protein